VCYVKFAYAEDAGVCGNITDTWDAVAHQIQIGQIVWPHPCGDELQCFSLQQHDGVTCAMWFHLWSILCHQVRDVCDAYHRKFTNVISIHLQSCILKQAILTVLHISVFNCHDRHHKSETYQHLIECSHQQYGSSTYKNMQTYISNILTNRKRH